MNHAPPEEDCEGGEEAPLDGIEGVEGVDLGALGLAFDDYWVLGFGVCDSYEAWVNLAEGLVGLVY